MIEEQETLDVVAEEETQEESKKDRIELWRAHLNRIPTKNDHRGKAKRAMNDQEGLCILNNRLLKKSKLIFGLFHPAEPEKFDGYEEIPFLLHEEFFQTPKMLIEAKVYDFFYGLFDVPIPKPDLTPKKLSPEQEAMLEKLQK